MSSPTLDFRNTNSLWCSVLAETLARSGLRQAVISPGSRSTPLTVAFARHPKIESISVLDERSAAFFALGLAKQNHEAVVLVCTSGTAGANYFPAIIEAQESNVPLLVITADRPPEMRECGSGQTIDQQKLFGSHVNFYHELAVPEASLERLGYLRQTVAHALERTCSPEAGPVHLNAPFRDPLPPVEDGSTDALKDKIDESFFAHLETPIPVPQITAVQRPATARGLIVAGTYAPKHEAVYMAKLQELATMLGWPVLADALSPVRQHDLPGVTRVTAYDAILRNERAARELTPQTVICLGGWPTSKVLRGWLEQSRAEILLVSPTVRNRDALHGKTRSLMLAPEHLRAASGGSADSAYAQAWAEAEKKARGILDGRLGTMTEMFEGRATWLLAQSLPSGTPVFMANSMPVRDVEYFWPAGNRGLRPFFNRGANGIDGTLSTALGVAHGGKPAVLLTGDLALLHDSNGFLLGPRLRGSLTIVLINNNGGGIFEHLPVAAFDPPFEEFIATPQQVDFAKLCLAHGVEHVLVRDWKQFIELTTTLPKKGIRVLEVRTDRKRDAALRKELFKAAAGVSFLI